MGRTKQTARKTIATMASSLQRFRRCIIEEDWSGVTDQIRKHSNSHLRQLSEGFRQGKDDGLLLASANKSAPLSIIAKLIDISSSDCTAKATNKRKATSLHLACETGSSETVSILCSEAGAKLKKMASAKDVYNLSPLGILWDKFLNEFHCTYFGWNRDTFNIEGNYLQLLAKPWEEGNDDCRDVITDAWVKSALVLEPLSREESKRADGSWSITHAIVASGLMCPVILLWAHLKRLPPSQSCGINSKGDTPLHVFLSSSQDLDVIKQEEFLDEMDDSRKEIHGK